MKTRRIERAGNGLQGEIRIPGDKSISHRSVMIAGIGDGTVHISHFLRAQDCLSTVAGMRQLGVPIRENEDGSLDVTGVGLEGLTEPEAIIDAGDSGTMLRLMLGLLAPQPFLTTFTGDALLYKRPMGRVIKPLSMMGARLAGRQQNKFLPITVMPAGRPLQGIIYPMPVASAQVKSAILLAGLRAEGETTVVEPVVSRDHTERMLEAFGVSLRKEDTSVTIHRPDRLCSPEAIDIPGDISSAAFWLVAASVIPGSDLLLRNVGVNPTRTGVIDVLRDMGADIQVLDPRTSGGEPAADLRVRSAALHGVSFGQEIMPRLIDEIPVIAVAALFAKGDTEITGAGELRVKETDRIRAVAEEFRKLAPNVEELPDGLLIHGGARLQPARCRSFDDHRIAMALAIAGAAGDGVEIEDPGCVDISYPAFYQTLEDIRR